MEISSKLKNPNYTPLLNQWECSWPGNTCINQQLYYLGAEVWSDHLAFKVLSGTSLLGYQGVFWLRLESSGRQYWLAHLRKLRKNTLLHGPYKIISISLDCGTQIVKLIYIEY